MNTFEQIRPYVAWVLCGDEDCITPELDLRDGLMADELDIIEIISGLERRFDVSIPDAEIDKIKTVRDLMQCIERAKGGADDANH